MPSNDNDDSFFWRFSPKTGWDNLAYNGMEFLKGFPGGSVYAEPSVRSIVNFLKSPKAPSNDTVDDPLASLNIPQDVYTRRW
jgi:hypothetical protein